MPEIALERPQTRNEAPWVQACWANFLKIWPSQAAAESRYMTWMNIAPLRGMMHLSELLRANFGYFLICSRSDAECVLRCRSYVIPT